MEIGFRESEKGPLVAALLIIILLGLASLFFTWQSLRRQREAIDEHMRLAASSILRGVEANLIRSMKKEDRGNNFLPPVFSPMTREMFSEIVQDEDVVFLALMGPKGKFLITSSRFASDYDFSLPSSIYQTLKAVGSWRGTLMFGDKETMAYGHKAKPPLFRMWMGGHVKNVHGTFYLLVGLDPVKHTAQFKQFRRAALLQTGYVFLAAMLLWVLAFAYLRRRDQDRKLSWLERFHSKLLDNMPDGLLTLGPGGIILAANKAAQDLLPSGNGGLVGSNFHQIAFEPVEASEDREIPWAQWDMEGKHLEMLSIPLRDHDGSDQLVLIRDRTAMKTLEDDLSEAQRLAMIGSLAAGVAHEIRNPLSSLRGFAQFFATKLKGQKPFETYATTMVQEADRLNRVVTDLLYLARPRAQHPEDIEINGLALSVGNILKFDLDNKQAKLEVNAQGLVHADPDGLKQALINLVANSLDAFSRTDGIITIDSCRFGQYVMVTVSDDGAGMDGDTRKKALEPFFTAKDKGTGLGLAIVQSIMRGHRGSVLIESEPGRGTCVSLLFPHVDSNINDSGK